MMLIRLLLISLTLLMCQTVQAHDEPFIVCDVTVIDTGGKPVDGAQVFVICSSFESKSNNERIAKGITSVSGQIRLQWPTQEDTVNFVFAYKPGLSLGWSLVRSWCPRHRIILQLGKVVPISGMVVDEDGRPVADAVVKCKPQSSSEFNFSGFSYDMDVSVLKTRTGPDGRFIFEVLSDDMTTDFFVTHPQFAPHCTDARSTAPGHTYRPGQEGIVITLSKGCTVRGKVTDEAGKGLAGVPVHARMNTNNEAYRGLYFAVSQEDGQFMITNMPQETFTITTGGEPFKDQSQWPSLGCIVRTQKDKPALAAVKIEKGFPVEFSVIDAKTKRPIPNTSIDLALLLKSGTMLGYWASGKTDSSGRLTRPCFSGTCSVTAYSKGYIGMFPTQTKIDKSIKQIPISLNPELSVTGKVVDAEGKTEAGIWVYPLPGTDKAHDLTDSSGRFALQFQPMSKQVYLLAQDFEKNLYALTEVTEDKTDYTLRLQKGLTVKGKVVDEQGHPIQGVLVKPYCYVPHAMGMIGDNVLSDKNGDYTFRAVPPTRDQMTYTFWIYAAGYGGGEIKKIKITNQEDTFTLPQLSLPAADCSVRGVAVDEKGNPMPNLFVSINGSRGSQTGSQPHYSHVTDSKGGFYFPNVCKGPLSIQVGWAHDNPGSLQACGGDQNLKVVFHKRLIHPEHPTMIGRPIPPLCFDNKPIEPNQIEGKRIAVCFWNSEPETMKLASGFSRQLESFSRDEVSAHFVSIYPLESKKRQSILKQFSWPVYDSIRWTEMDMIQRKWGAQETPWFIVTDKQHMIIYEGKSPDKAKSALQAGRTGSQ